jgi:hypothetical protein
MNSGTGERTSARPQPASASAPPREQRYVNKEPPHAPLFYPASCKTTFGFFLAAGQIRQGKVALPINKC